MLTLWKGVSRDLFGTFYDTVVALAVFYAIVCCGGSNTDRDRKRLNKMEKRAGSVLGSSLDFIEEVADRRMLARRTSVRCNPSTLCTTL